jgi:hypothetical protein|tara:strand:- start:1411 stop:1860 length:450 start_codon:yes stop_codon:yes gene_type:complete
MSDSGQQGDLDSTADGREFPARCWHALDDGRIQCDLCPRFCKLNEGQRGLCFVRARVGDEMVLATYGRSSGYYIDPIEKKPLNHFGQRTGRFGVERPCNCGWSDVFACHGHGFDGLSETRIYLISSPNGKRLPCVAHSRQSPTERTPIC